MIGFLAVHLRLDFFPEGWRSSNVEHYWPSLNYFWAYLGTKWEIRTKNLPYRYFLALYLRNWVGNIHTTLKDLSLTPIYKHLSYSLLRKCHSDPLWGSKTGYISPECNSNSYHVWVLSCNSHFVNIQTDFYRHLFNILCLYIGFWIPIWFGKIRVIKGFAHL